MNAILTAFGLQPSDFTIAQIGTGHIHRTYKLTGERSFVLQRVNKNVFKNPEIIASNLRTASDYLKVNFPQYPFFTCNQSVRGKEMEYDEDGYPWRLFPYVENTITIDKVSTVVEAFSAASEFARLTCYLDKIDVSRFGDTIPQFHDLALRYREFETALSQATRGRKEAARKTIKKATQFYPLAERYSVLIKSGSLRLRITHNDTKINNILFDKGRDKAVGVIDLDTLMPGYFIYDLGDMIRTFVCPVSEEEKDFSKIVFRSEIYDAVISGYLSQMERVMSGEEQSAIPFAGKMMTYIMALRFLADYLNGNTYYHTVYPEQNLVRATNQLRLLEILSEKI